MNSEINCTAIMNKICETLDDSEDSYLWDIMKECKDEWSSEYAIICVDLMEEDYRDYEQVKNKLLKTIKNLVPEPFVAKTGYKKNDPKTPGLVLHIWPNQPYSFEFELYVGK